jgi:hypothetical protein
LLEWITQEWRASHPTIDPCLLVKVIIVLLVIVPAIFIANIIVLLLSVDGLRLIGYWLSLSNLIVILLLHLSRLVSTIGSLLLIQWEDRLRQVIWVRSLLHTLGERRTILVNWLSCLLHQGRLYWILILNEHAWRECSQWKLLALRSLSVEVGRQV